MTTLFKKIKKPVLVAIALATLQGCTAPGASLSATAYDEQDIGNIQSTAIVQIMSVEPATIKVSNKANKAQTGKIASIAGAVLGAVVGHQYNHRHGAVVGGLSGAATSALVTDASVSSSATIEGVLLSGRGPDGLWSVTQVGRLCQYKEGDAIAVQVNNKVKIRPNNTCGGK